MSSSLPGSSSLPTELLPLLERFQRLTLWFPGDVVSWYAVRVFARKLAERRCFTVRYARPLSLSGFLDKN